MVATTRPRRGRAHKVVLAAVADAQSHAASMSSSGSSGNLPTSSVLPRHLESEQNRPFAVEVSEGEVGKPPAPLNSPSRRQSIDAPESAPMSLAVIGEVMRERRSSGDISASASEPAAAASLAEREQEDEINALAKAMSELEDLSPEEKRDKAAASLAHKIRPRFWSWTSRARSRR